ncbi:unnamed protein product [Brachionus calyciflorus]|uniref:Uncharacterized protein n=1 Tax=Brachionus calyciflorus TaxID=104777 RepID=A0A814KMZ3_9BILA|nr:unnamed protein product [Brachionus calyciflorus]
MKINNEVKNNIDTFRGDCEEYLECLKTAYKKPKIIKRKNEIEIEDRDEENEYEAVENWNKKSEILITQEISVVEIQNKQNFVAYIVKDFEITSSAVDRLTIQAYLNCYSDLDSVYIMDSVTALKIFSEGNSDYLKKVELEKYVSIIAPINVNKNHWYSYDTFCNQCGIRYAVDNCKNYKNCHECKRTFHLSHSS